MSKNTEIKSITRSGHTLVLKLSPKKGLYFVLDGKTNFFPNNKVYWNTPDDITAAEQHIVVLIQNKYPEIYAAMMGHKVEEINNNNQEEAIMKEEPEDNNVVNLEAWAIQTGAQGISEQQVDWIRPFIDFTKLCNHVNRTLKTAFMARYCTINGAGEIHSKDNYMGVVLFNEQFIFVDKEGNITPMSAFKAGKRRPEDQGFVVTRADGSTVHYFKSLAEAGKFAADNSTDERGLRVYIGKNRRGNETYSVYLPAPQKNINNEGGK